MWASFGLIFPRVRRVGLFPPKCGGELRYKNAFARSKKTPDRKGGVLNSKEDSIAQLLRRADVKAGLNIPRGGAGRLRPFMY